MTEQVPETLQESKDFVYRTAQEMPPEIKDLIYKEWLPRVMAGALRAASELPPEHRDHILKGMSDACAPMAVEVCGIRPDMSLDEYLKHMTELDPPLGPRTIDWSEGVVEVDYHPPRDAAGKPVCQCPLIQLGMAEPFPELCLCSARTGARFIEAYTQRPTASVELLGSIHSGLETCRYRVHLDPSTTTESK
jgi:hypothetical protein